MNASLVAGCLVLAVTQSAPHAGNERARLEQAVLAKLDREFARVRLEMLKTIDAELPVPFLGIDIHPPAKDSKEPPKLSKIFAGSGAEAAGLRVDDVLLDVAGKRVTNLAEIRDAVRAFRVGDRLPVRVRRGDQEIAVTATLGRRPFEGEDEEIGEETPPPFPAPRRVDFEPMPPGSAPAGMHVGRTGLGEPARFVVVEAGDAASGKHLLRQESCDPDGYRFPFAILDDSLAGDFRASVSFRFVSGESDRAAGLVFRFQDENNYLVARANSLEKDVRLFRVLSGVRRQVPGAVREIDLGAPGWHRLEVVVRGHDVVISVDGTKAIESADTNWSRGLIGLWTKSDAVTEFDDLVIEPTN